MPPRKKQTTAQSSTARSGIINAINSPLGFYVLALLIAESTIGLVLVKSDLDAKDKFYGLLLAVGMFVFVVFVVSLLVWFKAENLTFDRDAHLFGRLPYGSETKRFRASDLNSLSQEPTAKEEVRNG